MARDNAEAPEIRVEDADIPTGEATQEAGAQGDDLASPAVAEGAAAAPAAKEEHEPAKAPAGARSERAVRRYRPIEDYAEGDRIEHPVWNVIGTVRSRDPQERIFRVSLGRAEERGRCHKIVVEFDEDVPTADGPRREVAMIADWHGRAFEVGVTVPILPEPEPILVAPGQAERPARRAPALPEIPEPSELEEEEIEEEEDTEEEEEEEAEEEGLGPIVI